MPRLMRLMRTAVLAPVLVSGLVVTAPNPPAGAEPVTTGTSAVLFSEREHLGEREFLARGVNRVWRDGNGDVAVSGSVADGSMVVTATGGEVGTEATFRFAAPQGEALAVRRYENAAVERGLGVPQLDIRVDDRSCFVATGSFDVRHLAADLSSLWVVYEMHCFGGPRAVFGEIKVAMPRDPDVLIAPTAVRWPDQDVGSTGAAVPVEILNTGRTGLGVDLATSGSEFALVFDDCGDTLDPGDSCSAHVSFTPSEAGERAGVLGLTLGGRDHAVPLTGTGIGGETFWTMVSDPRDHVGDGATYRFGPPDDIEANGGNPFRGIIEVAAPGWEAVFQAAEGPLVPGTYEAARYPNDRPGLAGIEVLRPGGVGCNEIAGTFTIEEARYDDAGALLGVRLTFVQRCDNVPGVLRGRIAWRSEGSATGGAPALGVRPAGRSVGYDAPVAIGVADPDSPGSEVVIEAIDGVTGETSEVALGRLDADGRFVTSRRLTRSADLVARVDGLASDSVPVMVRAAVTLDVRGHRRRDGDTYYVGRRDLVRLTATLNRGARGCIAFVTGPPRPRPGESPGSSACLRPDADGRVQITASVRGGPARVVARFQRTGPGPNVGAASRPIVLRPLARRQRG